MVTSAPLLCCARTSLWPDVLCICQLSVNVLCPREGSTVFPRLYKQTLSLSEDRSASGCDRPMECVASRLSGCGGPAGLVSSPVGGRGLASDLKPHAGARASYCCRDKHHHVGGLGQCTRSTQRSCWARAVVWAGLGSRTWALVPLSSFQRLPVRKGHRKTAGICHAGRSCPFALTDAVCLCGHREALAPGHMSPWGAPIGPSAAGRAGMEKACT